jgi:hypothetical protein
VLADLAEEAYFHRELPYDRVALEAMHPRLRDARALAEGGAVTLTADATTRLGVHAHIDGLAEIAATPGSNRLLSKPVVSVTGFRRRNCRYWALAWDGSGSPSANVPVRRMTCQRSRAPRTAVTSDWMTTRYISWR